MQQESSLLRLSELETTGLDNQFSQGIDRSVGTKHNLIRQDETTQSKLLVVIVFSIYSCYLVQLFEYF